MIIACWSVKGGSGTTVVSASLAVLLARASRRGAAGRPGRRSRPPSSACRSPPGPGLAEWLAAPAPAPDVLRRLTVPTGAGLELLPPGGSGRRPPVGAGRALAAGPGRGREAPVVVDAGLLPAGVGGGRRRRG